MIAKFLFALGLIILPFNNIPHFVFILGEMGLEGSFLPFLFLVIHCSIQWNFSYKLPRSKSFFFLLSFLLILIASGITNIPNIVNAQFMGRTGLSKFFFQFLVLFFGLSLSIIIFNLFIFNIINLNYVRKFLTVSFIICGIYSFFEIFYLFGYNWAETFLEAINPLFHSEDTGILFPGKVRSVTAEPSYFGMYGALLLPWLISYLFTEKKSWPFALLSLYLIFLMLLSLSRLAYGMLLVEALLLFYFIFRARVISLGGTTIALTLLAVTISASIYAIQRMAEADVELLRQGVVLSLASEENLSNICRYGTQVAAVHMGLDHPLLGTGLGQFPFYMEKYLPTWSMVSPEIRSYLHGEGLPRVHGMYARIFSEMGSLGLLFWLIFVISLIIQNWRLVSRYYDDQPDWLGLALLINMLAILFFGLSIATFRKLEMWIIFGLSYGYYFTYFKKT
jgi:hypothetical protein